MFHAKFYSSNFFSDRLCVDGDGVVCWYKPPMGWIKVNVDAASFQASSESGFGMLARRDDGTFIAAHYVSSLGIFSSTMTELMGVHEALSWVKDQGWSRVIVEMDVIAVFQALCNPVDYVSSFGLLLANCLQLVDEIVVVKFSIVKRTANSIAHVLARASDDWSTSMFWDDTVPLFLSLC